MADEQLEQPAADSNDDKIASLFGGAEFKEPETADPEAQPEAEAADPVEETFDFEVDGEKYTLPKKLEKAVMQEKDYTQKSQTLAEQKRAIELQDRQFRVAKMQLDFGKEIQDEMQQIGMLDTVLKQAVDWSSMNTDEVIRKKLDLDQLKERRQELMQGIETKHREFSEKQSAEFDKIKAQSLDVIKRKVPAWNADTAKAVRAHALNEGYTEAELASIIDPRHALTLWKAHQFDELQAKAQPTVKDAKVVKTSPSNPMTQKTKDLLNFRKTMKTAKPGSSEQKQALSDRIAAKFGG